MPSNNAQGNQVWNPSVGIYFKPAANQRESYGGIIGALNDNIETQGGVNKAYPHNFAGIIAAIEDLTYTQKEVPVTPEVKPPGGDIDPNTGEWVWGTVPRDGELWYDTRQGRLFIALEGEYYQTNGADGLAQITTDGVAPTNPVMGQFWWDTGTQDLYIFDGFWMDPDGNPQGNKEPGYTAIWRLVVDTSEGITQTSGTLPLANGDTRAVASNSLLPEQSLMYVQSDFNSWVLDSLEILDTNVLENSGSAVVVVGTNPPDSPKVGDLWYDSVGLDLSVWYEDNDSGQWVPTSTAYSYEEAITTLNTRITLEEFKRSQTIETLEGQILSIQKTDIEELRRIEQRINSIQTLMNAQPDIDLSGYTTTANLTAEVNTINNTINDIKNSLPTTQELASSSQLTALTNSLSELPTAEEVQTAITAALPNVSAFVTQADITNSINNITTQYLPRNGGVVQGTFTLENSNADKATFDFSNNKWNGRKSHKYQTNTADENSTYTTFGTNMNPWEYSWAFNSNEDFCWVYNDTNKVFSITKEGPACSELYLGNIMPENGNGRQIANKIGVKDKLIKYETAFASLRSGVASAANFDELKANILSSLSSI